LRGGSDNHWVPGIALARSTRATSLAQQPEDEAQQRRDDQPGRQRKIEREAFALEVEVAGEPPEAELRGPRPGDADHDQNDTERDEQSRHERHRTVSRWTSALR